MANTKTLGRLALEVFSIVLGVLLALGVSEWQEERQRHERLETGLTNIASELTSNLQILRMAHENNTALLERLETDVSSAEEGQFIPALQISDAAWEMLRATGLAAYVELELATELTQTYSIMDIYRQTGYGIINANLSMLATATARGTDVAEIDESNLFTKNFASNFQLIVAVEEALIETHVNALDVLDSRQQ